MGRLGRWGDGETGGINDKSLNGEHNDLNKVWLTRVRIQPVKIPVGYLPLR
jgi:hypothetical protein